jgi:hypothetical protein
MILARWACRHSGAPVAGLPMAVHHRDDEQVAFLDDLQV